MALSLARQDVLSFGHACCGRLQLSASRSWNLGILILAVVVFACGHMTTKAHAQDQGSSNHWFVLEEFSTDSGYWHSLILDIDARAGNSNAVELRRDYVLNGFAYTGPGAAPFGVAIEDGYDDFAVTRDPGSKTVQVSPGQSRLADWLNDVALDPRSRDSVERWTENSVLIDSYMENISNVSTTSITYVANRLDLSRGKALVVEYLSEPFFYTHSRNGESYDIEQRFRGFFVIDGELTETYYYAHQYSGSVDGETFSGLQQGVLAGQYDYPAGSGLCGPTAAGGASGPGAVLSQNDLAQIESRARSYRRVNLGVGQDDQQRLRHPEWFPGLFGATRSVHTASSVLGELASGVYPVVTIIPGAHMIDSGYVLGRSIIEDVLQDPSSALITDRDSLLYSAYGAGSPEQLRYFQTDESRTKAAVAFFDDETKERLPDDLVRIDPETGADWGVPLASLDLNAQCVLGRLGFAATAVFNSGKTYSEFSQDLDGVHRASENFRANFDIAGEAAASAADGTSGTIGGTTAGGSTLSSGTIIGGVAVLGGLAAGAVALGGGGGGGGGGDDDGDSGPTTTTPPPDDTTPPPDDTTPPPDDTTPPPDDTTPPPDDTTPPPDDTTPPPDDTTPPPDDTTPPPVIVTPPPEPEVCDNPGDPDNPPSAERCDRLHRMRNGCLAVLLFKRSDTDARGHCNLISVDVQTDAFT